MPRLCSPRSGLRRTISRAQRAFTLLETGIAIIIIGVGVLAMIEAQQALIQRNAWSTHSSTATFLAGEIREMVRGWPRHDVYSGGLYFDDPTAHTGFHGWGREANESLAEDFDDLDDLDGVMFGDAPNAPGAIGLRLPGPINAFRDVIPETDWNGNTPMVNGQPATLRGWSQYVMVDKLDPNDFTVVRPHDYYIAAVAGQPAVDVDRFPVRVTVVVLYKGDLETEATEVARVVWVVQ